VKTPEDVGGHAAEALVIGTSIHHTPAGSSRTSCSAARSRPPAKPPRRCQDAVHKQHRVTSPRNSVNVSRGGISRAGRRPWPRSPRVMYPAAMEAPRERPYSRPI
jgi:hypothetical protein